MPVWFGVWFLVALVGFAASPSGDLVLVSSVYSFGVLIPVWFIAANLWLVLALAAPWAWFAHRGRPILGLCISGATVAVLVTAFVVTTSAQREGLMPAPQMATGTSFATPARSLEISYAGEPGNRRDCDELCDRLLTGGDVDWVRIRYLATPYLLAPSLIYARAPAGDCTALYPAFDVASPCLLARKDDAVPADLVMQITRTGDSYGRMSPGTSRVYLTGTENLTLTDTRSGTGPMVIQTRITWDQPVLGFLIPNMTALGSGETGPGVSLPIRRGSSGSIDPIASISVTGLRLGPTRSTLISDRGYWSLWAFAAYDPPLVASLLAATLPTQLSPQQNTIVQDWLNHYRRTTTSSPDIDRIMAAVEPSRSRPWPAVPAPAQQGLAVAPVFLPPKPIDPTDVILQHFQSGTD